MKSFIKKIKWWQYLISIFLFIFSVAWIFIAYNDMRLSDNEVADYFDERQVNYDIKRIAHRDTEIRFVSSGIDPSEAETVIIFIHGAPGASDSFYSYLTDLTLSSRAHLISMDRLGYGYSSYGNPETNIIMQADAVLSILKYVQAKKVILVGHSYGAAIAGMLAAERPDLIIANFMLGSVIDPEEEIIFFFSSWPSIPIVKHLFSKAIQVSSFEKMSHAEELRSIEKLWQKITVPTILMHGGKDWIAPVTNAQYLNDKVDSPYLTIDIDENATHFILWEDQERVVEKILEFL